MDYSQSVWYKRTRLAGERAARENVPRGACPYGAGQWSVAQRQAWFEGYDQAIQDKAVRQK